VILWIAMLMVTVEGVSLRSRAAFKPLDRSRYVNPGQPWSKVVPGAVATIPDQPNVVVPLLNDFNLPNVTATQGDTVLFKNLNSNRVIILNSTTLPNFNSPFLYPFAASLVGSEVIISGPVTSVYKYTVFVPAGNYSYSDIRTGQNATFTVEKSRSRDPSFFTGFKNVN